VGAENSSTLQKAINITTSFIYPTSHNHLQLQRRRRRRRWADEKILPLSRWRPSAAICFQKDPAKINTTPFSFFDFFFGFFAKIKSKKSFAQTETNSRLDGRNVRDGQCFDSICNAGSRGALVVFTKEKEETWHNSTTTRLR
jgi:hypothetical protein